MYTLKTNQANSSNISTPYRPIIIATRPIVGIIILFKTADLKLAEYFKTIYNYGNVYIEKDRGYILWQIQDITNRFV
ncbi:hypothetical protein V1504DRAFT_189608 [Lipomyces starkeyi]